MRKFRVAEFFAGAGLIRRALEGTGSFAVVFANDIEPKKERLYRLNFGRSREFRLGDIRMIRGCDIPDCDLASASFPCTDLSLAGNRLGLKGEQSGAFHEFARILLEMGDRRPRAILVENVVGFASSHGGRDMRDAIAALNALGYACDPMLVDARWFSAQSRPRLLITGVQAALQPTKLAQRAEMLRPAWLRRFIETHSQALKFITLPIIPPDPGGGARLRSAVERLKRNDQRWWSRERTSKFVESLAPLHRQRLVDLTNSKRTSWATAYRRTRSGSATWEIRADDISGCLRTTRGGSSRQALVEAGRGSYRVRWMSAREYANLQGFPEFNFDPKKENDALFALGDAVCVPVVEWLAENCLRDLLAGKMREGKADHHADKWAASNLKNTYA